MKVGVVVFPGSNCDRDTVHVFQNVLGLETSTVWHKETELSGFTSNDLVVIPGGFSYGDYLRSGAIARFSPIMNAVVEHANNGGMVIGICNGFQVLCEVGLLPGALLRNSGQKFICKNIFLNSPDKTLNQSAYKIPIAHGEGRYYADDATIQELEQNGQILFRYCDEQGVNSEESNPNGSVSSIAGICSKNGNVIGMMPHPERASEEALGNSDGLALLEFMLASVVK